MFTIQDLADYTGLDIEDIPEARFNALVAEAEALIRAQARKLPSDYVDWPEAAKSVALRIVARVFEHRDFIGVTNTSMTAGPFTTNTTYSADATAGSLYLTKQDKVLLGAAGGTKAYSVDMIPRERAQNRVWVTPTWWQ